MAIPYELYVRFLVTSGNDDIALVNSLLSDSQLPKIEQEILDSQWNLIHATMPKDVIEQIEQKTYGEGFLEHMKVLEVEELWLAETAFKDQNMRTSVKLVRDIFSDPVLKITINALLIKRLSVQEITRLVNAKFATPLRETHVDLYMRFFFDARRMTRKDWKSYIRSCQAREQKMYFTALTESESTLKTELGLPATVSVSEQLQWLLTKSFYKAKMYMDIGTPDADKSAREWTDQVVKLADKYEKYRSGDQNDFAKTLQMEFDFVETEFETPDDSTYKAVSDKQRPKDT